MVSLPKFVSNKHQTGFTLIELLIVIAIIAVLLVITLARFGTFGRQIDLNTTSQKILSTLQAARTQTLASEEESVYGVHFETNKYILFKGSVYSPADPENKEFTLSSTEIYEINLTGGGSEVVFTRVRGTTANSGNVKIKVIAEPSRTQTVVINSLGQVSLEESVTPTGTRIADTRHLHFDLGWSIQTRNTLSLIFSNPPSPDVQEDVSIQDYLNPGKTEFSWEGSVDVYGSEQVLKIHTHFLDASNTILCVHRDRRYNDKALRIEIDGLRIVSYTAEGAATVGAAGGTMAQQ